MSAKKPVKKATKGKKAVVESTATSESSYDLDTLSTMELFYSWSK